MIKRIALVAVLTALSSACERPQEGPDGAPAPSSPPSSPTVSVAAPVAKVITEWDEFTGRFEAVNTVEVRARVSGYLDAVHFRDGEIVEKGALLFVIDPRPFEIALTQAKAGVVQAEVNLDLAGREAGRAESLARKRNIPEQEVDELRSRQQALAAELDVAKARLREVALELEWTNVRAPISGRISSHRVDVGNLVTGGTADATLLTTIVTIDPIHFVFEGSEADYLKYTRLDQARKRPSSRTASNPVQVRLIDEESFVHHGEMDFVDNVLDANTGTIRARAVFDNASGFLVPGLFGRLRLFGGEFDALLIPDSAILSDQARKIVLTVDDSGTVQTRVVKPGPMVDGLRVVRSGLSPGDRVVVEGLQRARAGQKVAPKAVTIEARGPDETGG